MLFSTQGEVPIRLDSLVTVKNIKLIKRLMHSRKIKYKTLHADLWLKVVRNLEKQIGSSLMLTGSRLRTSSNSQNGVMSPTSMRTMLPKRRRSAWISRNCMPHVVI